MKPVTHRELWLLAFPAIASALLNNAFRVVDQFQVQWLGTAAQAAIGSVTFVTIAYFAFFDLIAAGAGPLVARATGARDSSQLQKTVGNAVTLGGVVGALVCVVSFVAAGPITGLVGLQGDTQLLAASYLRWLGLAGFGLTLGPLMDAVFIAQGRTTIVMILLLGSTLINAVLNWVFMYELGMGIKGAALASGVARAGTVMVGLWVLWSELRWSLADMVPTMARRIVRVGFPMAANVLAYALVYWALLRFTISPLGPEVNAALGIGFSALEGMTWPAFHGISLAVASVVGRRLGAGQPDEAMRAVRLAIPGTTALGVLAGLVFYFGAAPLCSLFTSDPIVLEAAVVYATILAFSQPFVAWESLFEGTLAGAGDTQGVFVWSAPWNVMRVPLAWLFAFPLGWGAVGVWWAINLTTVVKALGKAGRSWRGRWLTLAI